MIAFSVYFSWSRSSRWSEVVGRICIKLECLFIFRVLWEEDMLFNSTKHPILLFRSILIAFGTICCFFTIFFRLFFEINCTWHHKAHASLRTNDNIQCHMKELFYKQSWPAEWTSFQSLLCQNAPLNFELSEKRRLFKGKIH